MTDSPGPASACPAAGEPDSFAINYPGLATAAEPDAVRTYAARWPA